jgi:hypothetical protein
MFSVEKAGLALAALNRSCSIIPQIDLSLFPSVAAF